jgi:hypothetical protein
MPSFEAIAPGDQFTKQKELLEATTESNGTKNDTFVALHKSYNLQL